MPVDRRYPLVRVLFQQFARDKFFQREHDAIFAPDPNCCATVLDRFHSVFDLEVAAIGGEDGVGEIVAGSYGRLQGIKSQLVNRLRPRRRCRLTIAEVASRRGEREQVTCCKTYCSLPTPTWSTL